MIIYLKTHQVSKRLKELALPMGGYFIHMKPRLKKWPMKRSISQLNKINPFCGADVFSSQRNLLLKGVCFFFLIGK